MLSRARLPPTGRSAGHGAVPCSPEAPALPQVTSLGFDWEAALQDPGLAVWAVLLVVTAGPPATQARAMDGWRERGSDTTSQQKLLEDRLRHL